MSGASVSSGRPRATQVSYARDPFGTLLEVCSPGISRVRTP
jgi:hypothetical protein